MESQRDLEKEEEEQEGEQARADLLRDRFRLSVISICEAEAKKNQMEIAEPVVACISNLAFKFSEQLAKDLELFAKHAGRKIVNVEDVILSAHRNEELAAMLRSFSRELAKEPQTERKRKRTTRKEDKDNLA